MSLLKDKITVLETNIDDMNPQVFAHVEDMLFQSGALDVWIETIQMKKNRPAFKFCCISPLDLSEKLASIILEETTSSGVRTYEVERFVLPRKIDQVDTPYGKVAVKIFTLPSGKARKVPEYEDCRKIAAEKKIPLIKIYSEILNSL